LRAGAYEFWSGEDENGSGWSGVHFVERPQDQGAARQAAEGVRGQRRTV